MTLSFNRSRWAALSCTALALLSAFANAQWSDVKQLGQGGESTVATDGKGNVYATAHEPCTLYMSRNWGATFSEKKDFPDGFCDIHVYAWPNGQVNVSFLKANVSGISAYYSKDSGKTIAKGVALDGPLDREWLAPNLANGETYFDFSRGYIGGPKSEGVFLAASTDGGKTFAQRSRIDKEPAGDYPVDPYLVTSSEGRIYGMWTTSRDYNTIDKFDFAYSTDNGHTFTGQQTLATLHKNLGDTQERWMLGCITAFGKGKVCVVYPNYAQIKVDGKDYTPMLLYYRYSSDGGATFSPEQTVSSTNEIEKAIRHFDSFKATDQNFGFYVQTLPWLCTDPYGRFYIAYQDNRTGQGKIKDADIDRWAVRFARSNDPSKGFAFSEQVSKPVTSIRPPLDFLSCSADKKYAYISWTEAPDVPTGWPFTGNLWFGRKPIEAPE